MKLDATITKSAWLWLACAGLAAVALSAGLLRVDDEMGLGRTEQRRTSILRELRNAAAQQAGDASDEREFGHFLRGSKDTQ